MENCTEGKRQQNHPRCDGVTADQTICKMESIKQADWRFFKFLCAQQQGLEMWECSQAKQKIQTTTPWEIRASISKRTLTAVDSFALVTQQEEQRAPRTLTATGRPGAGGRGGG